MDSTFYYAESARRKAKKMKALAQGLEAEQAQGMQPADNPALPSSPGTPTRVRPARTMKKVARPASATPVAQPRTPAIRRPAGAETIGGGLYKKSQAKQAAPGTAPRSAGRRVSRTSATGLKANEERLLLESKELDLFGTGTTSKVSVCPDCQHEAVKIVCLGIPVRACLDCKGVWLSYPLVKKFAREQEWFLQLGPAIQLEIDKKRKTGL